MKLTMTLAAAACSSLFALPVWATQTINTDIAIVGGGLAGLAAAQAAVDAGYKPVVLEKLPLLGGAGNFPEGSLGVNTNYQKTHNIKHPGVDAVIEAALSYHHYRADPAVLRVLIAESGKTIDWVEKKGATFRGIRTMYPPEESLMTWHLFVGGCHGVIERFEKEVRAKGGKILMETAVDRLNIKNGKVVGLEATVKGGDKVIVNAKKVIVATGGFASNKEMLAKYVFDSSAPGMSEPIWYRGPELDGRTGDGITMVQNIGGAITGMHTVAGNAPYLADHPPIRQFMGGMLSQGRCALAQPWLWVDRNGKRFFNESRGAVFVDVYNAMTTAGGVMYNITDQAKYDQLVNQGCVLPFNAIVLKGTKLDKLGEVYKTGMEKGWAFKANTIEELATKIGVPPANLRATMVANNKAVDMGYDPLFGKKKEHLVKFDLNKGPYYALKGIRAFFLTLGGIKVTPKFEATNNQGDVIPNVYVVGQDIGGLYDSTYDLRCEGSASSFAMTSGRVAAENAIAAIKAGM